MKIKYSDLLYLLMAITLVSKIQTRLKNPLYEDNIIILLSGIILLGLALLASNGKINISLLKVFGLLGLHVILFIFIFRNEALSSYLNSSFYAYAGYLSVAFGISGLLINHSALSVHKFVQISYITVFVFLAACYIINFDNFLILRNPLLLLETDFRRSRSDFGFVHANTTAGICFLFFVLHLMLKNMILDGFQPATRRFRSFMRVALIIMSVMLISTASRGTIIAVAALFSVEWYLKIDTNVANKNAVKILKPLIFGFMIIAVGIYLYVELIQSGTFDLSYRLQNFSDNIPGLIQSGRVWYGYGLVDKSVFGGGDIIAQTGYTDNFFLYVFVSTGILGCIIMAILFTCLIKGIMKGKRDANNTYYAITAIFIAQLVLSLSEGEFIHPASPNSLVCLIMYTVYCENQFKKPAPPKLDELNAPLKGRI